MQLWTIDKILESVSVIQHHLLRLAKTTFLAITGVLKKQFSSLCNDNISFGVTIIDDMNHLFIFKCGYFVKNTTWWFSV